MIDAKEAVSKARDYFQHMFENRAIQELLLEEAELSEDGKFWLITFGFDWQPSSGTASIGPGERKYKVMKLSTESGEMVAMKRAIVNG